MNLQQQRWMYQREVGGSALTPLQYNSIWTSTWITQCTPTRSPEFRQDIEWVAYHTEILKITLQCVEKGTSYISAETSGSSCCIVWQQGTKKIAITKITMFLQVQFIRCSKSFWMMEFFCSNYLVFFCQSVS